MDCFKKYQITYTCTWDQFQWANYCSPQDLIPTIVIGFQLNKFIFILIWNKYKWYLFWSVHENGDAWLHTPLWFAIASLFFIITWTSPSEGFLFSRYVISLQSLLGTEYIDLNLLSYNQSIQIHVIHPIFPKPTVYTIYV